MSSKLYLGIDVSKGYADLIVLDDNRKQVGKPFQLYDMKEGYAELESHLDSLVKRHNPLQIIAAVESTGTLENHWLSVLSNLKGKYPLQVARLNPYAVSQYRQADMSIQITDRSSSLAIARYLISHPDRVNFYEPSRYELYRKGISQIQLLLKQKVQLSNKLHQYLYEYFPEVVPICRNGFCNYKLELIIRYPVSVSMAKAKLGKESPISYVKIETLKELRERCRDNQLNNGNELIKSMIIGTAEQIRALEHQIKKLLNLIANELPQEQIDLLCSIPGIRKPMAVILLCQIGDLDRFKTPQQIVGFFGLYPVIKESGDGVKKPRMSRKGNHTLRRYLYMAALAASTHDPYLRSIYTKSVEKGMPKKAAICKIMKKLLRMVFGVLKNHQAFDPKVDMAHRERYKPSAHNSTYTDEKHTKIEDTMLWSLAPVSKKNAHTRKEQTGTVERTRSSKSDPAAPFVLRRVQRL